MSFEQPTEFQGSEGDIPDAIIDLLKADICPGTGGGDVAPSMVPPDAPVGADIAHLEAVGVLERWQFGGHCPRGGLGACGGGAHVERLMRPCMVELVTAVVALPLVRAKVGTGWSGGFGFERPMHPLVAAVLVRSTGCDELRYEAQAHPPRGQLGEPGQGVGGKGHAVVGADALRQAACFEHAREHRFGLLYAGGGEGLAREQKAAVAIADGQWLAVAAVTGLEVSFEVGTPHLVGGTNMAEGFARMPDNSAPALLGHQTVAAEDVTDGRACRPRPAGMAWAEDRHQLLGSPGRMSLSGFKDRRHHIVRRVAGRRAGPTGSLFEALWAMGEMAVNPFVPGLAADAVKFAELGH